MNEGDSSKEPRLSGYYYLDERTALLGEAVIEFAKSVEGDCAYPTPDFPDREAQHFGGCELHRGQFRKSAPVARETKHWIRMIVKASPEHRKAATPLWREANESHLTFSKIRRTTLDRP
jgi:hypothetical protein